MTKLVTSLNYDKNNTLAVVKWRYKIVPYKHVVFSVFVNSLARKKHLLMSKITSLFLKLIFFNIIKHLFYYK